MANKNFFQYESPNGQTFWVMWLAKSPVNKAAVCDRCNRRVMKDEPRLCIDNGAGKFRARGKGKYHQDICTECAINVPNHPANNIQTELF